MGAGKGKMPSPVKEQSTHLSSLFYWPTKKGEKMGEGKRKEKGKGADYLPSAGKAGKRSVSVLLSPLSFPTCSSPFLSWLRKGHGRKRREKKRIWCMEEEGKVI